MLIELIIIDINKR